MPSCDYCGREVFAYTLESDRGPKDRCVPCLAIEQAQPGVGWEQFRDYPDHLKEHTITTANDWLTVLARIVQDDPLIEQDPATSHKLSEGTRKFLTNIMGSDAHASPSEVVGSDVDIAQSTLGDENGR